MRSVGSGVGVWGSSSRRCTGVRGGMVGVCGECTWKSSGIDVSWWSKCSNVEHGPPSGVVAARTSIKS